MALRPRSVAGSARAVSVSGVNETSAGAGASATAAATRSTVAVGSISIASTPCESGDRASATKPRSIRADSVVSSTMTNVTSVSRMRFSSSMRSMRIGMAPGSRRRISPISSSGRVMVNRSPDPTAISVRSSMMKFARSEFSVGGFWMVSRIRSGSSIGRNTRTSIWRPGSRFGSRTLTDTSSSATKVVWETRSMRPGPRWALADPLVTPNARATTAASRRATRRITGLAGGRSVDAQPGQSRASCRARVPQRWPPGC